jgi:hypothetical protein
MISSREIVHVPRLEPDEPFPLYAYVPGRFPHPTADSEGYSFGTSPALPSKVEPDQWYECRPYLQSLISYAGIKIYRRWLDRGVELSVALMRFSFLDARLLRQRPHSVVPAGLVRSADSAAFFAQRISFAPWSLWPPAARAAFAAGA